ncbi:MAG: glucosamine inositolphosphorylceramide transferase family protein [Paracoccaceae bacterium]
MGEEGTAKRIGIVLAPGERLTGRQALVIDRLAADPGFQIVGRIEGAETQPPACLPVLANGVLAAERALTRLRWPDYPRQDAQDLVDALPVLDEDGPECAADVILALGHGRLSAGQLGVAAQGEWSLGVSGVPAARSDWVLMDPDQRAAGLVSVEILQRTTDRPQEHVRARAAYNPKPTALLTSAFIAEKSALFLRKALTEAAAPGPDAPHPAPPRPGTAALLKYAAHVARMASGRATDRVRVKLGRGRAFWRLAVGRGNVMDFEPAKALDVPRRSFLMADPFLFEKDGELFVFYEAQNADERPAWIEVGRLDGNRLIPLGPALRCDYHLSYPFVFRDGDEIYMMPETQTARRLEVWRATDFPLQWERHATAFEGDHIADSNIFRHGGQWWLMTNLSDHVTFQEHSSELYLFSVDGPSLTGLRPHPQNPVVIGSGVARNAGAIVEHEGRLFRASQNNSHGIYGYGLNIVEIEELTPDTYRERLVRSFTPADRPGARGLHHVSFAAGRFVLDWSGK